VAADGIEASRGGTDWTAGEVFVMGFELRRLERAGRDDLARTVRRVSDVDGDGYGYDV
jgi:hypothetical protein